MPLSRFSLLSGVATAGFAVALAIPAHGASFDFNQLELIKVVPLSSTDRLSFFGAPTDNQGYTVFFNSDVNAPDAGHIEVSKNNLLGSRAPYYASGRNSSPEIGNTATRSATLEGINGFYNFFNYINNNFISLSDIGYGFGVKSGQDFRETWNLGDDIFGEDWLGSPTSTIEERIYTADPNAVERFLTFETNKILQFNYSPENVVFDYGATASSVDNIELLFSYPVSVTKEEGLSPLLDGLSDAFIADVNQNGGQVQFISEDEGALDLSLAFNDPYVIANIRLPLSVQVVAVPEPSSILGILGLGTIGFLIKLRKAMLLNKRSKQND